MNYCSECKTHGTRGHKLDCSHRWSNRADDYYNTTEEAWKGSSQHSETGDGSGGSSESDSD